MGAGSPAASQRVKIQQLTHLITQVHTYTSVDIHLVCMFSCFFCVQSLVHIHDLSVSLHVQKSAQCSGAFDKFSTLYSCMLINSPPLLTRTRNKNPPY